MLAGRDENGFARGVKLDVDRHAGERRCLGCRRWKPEDRFHFRPSRGGSFRKTCRECHSAKRRARYQDHIETERARALRRYRAGSKSKLSAMIREMVTGL